VPEEVKAENLGDGLVRISWDLRDKPPSDYHHSMTVVNVVGQKFKKEIDSAVRLRLLLPHSILPK